MNILHAIRSTILAAFFSLPLLFISFTAFLAIALGTPGLFILLLGQLLLSVTTFAFHLTGNILGSFVPLLKPVITIRADRASLVQRPIITDRASIVQDSTSGDINVFPSYWMVHVIFFLSYLLANAHDVFIKEPDSGASSWQVSNRRSKAVAVLIVLSISMLSLILFRYFLTGAETWGGAALSLFVIPIGFGWYQLAKVCGARESDIFGIIQQMTPNGGAPTSCVYTPIA